MIEKYTHIIAVCFIASVIAFLALITVIQKEHNELISEYQQELIDINIRLQNTQSDLKVTRQKLEAEIAKHEKTSSSYAQYRARAHKSSRNSSVRVSGIAKQATQTLRTPTGASKVGKAFLSKYFSGSQLEVAYKIMMCESGGRTHARNGGHYGIFQLAARYHYKGRNPEDLYNPDLNARIAARLASDGWSEWSCK